MDALQFVAMVNKSRLANRNKWLFFSELVNGKRVELKFYSTSIQILRVDGVTHPSIYDASVRDFKAAILAAVQ